MVLTETIFQLISTFSPSIEIPAMMWFSKNPTSNLQKNQLKPSLGIAWDE